MNSVTRVDAQADKGSTSKSGLLLVWVSLLIVVFSSLLYESRFYPYWLAFLLGFVCALLLVVFGGVAIASGMNKKPKNVGEKEKEDLRQELSLLDVVMKVNDLLPSSLFFFVVSRGLASPTSFS